MNVFNNDDKVKLYLNELTNKHNRFTEFRNNREVFILNMEIYLPVFTKDLQYLLNIIDINNTAMEKNKYIDIIDKFNSIQICLDQFLLRNRFYKTEKAIKLYKKFYIKLEQIFQYYSHNVIFTN